MLFRNWLMCIVITVSNHSLYTAITITTAIVITVTYHRRHCAVDQPVHNWLFYTTHGYPEHPPASELSGAMAVGSAGYGVPRETAGGRFPVGVPIASGRPTRSPLSFGGVTGELAVAMPFGKNYIMKVKMLPMLVHNPKLPDSSPSN